MQLNVYLFTNLNELTAPTSQSMLTIPRNRSNEEHTSSNTDVNVIIACQLFTLTTSSCILDFKSCFTWIWAQKRVHDLYDVEIKREV